jgi:hypothetical protein
MIEIILMFVLGVFAGIYMVYFWLKEIYGIELIFIRHGHIDLVYNGKFLKRKKED